METGAHFTVDIEKPVVGGRMLARHNGQVVLVSGAIPEERVRVRVERSGRHVLYAETIEVLAASGDRREASPDWRCGGNVYAHVVYDRQIRLKAEIIRETLQRIGRLTLDQPPVVVASPEYGYRMRARLHASNGRLGFFREGTHELCDPAATGQFLPATLSWIAETEGFLRDRHRAGVSGVELTENLAGDERACYFDLQPGIDAAPFTPLIPTTVVRDTLRVRENDPGSAFRLRRSARAFFQGNRFLLETLMRQVAGLVPDGPVVDLYSGVGLFGLSVAIAGIDDVTLVEGDPISGGDLRANAEAFGQRVRVEQRSVEAFLAGPLRARPTYSSIGTRPTDRHVNRVPPKTAPATAYTFIVDPPRTGISQEAMAGIVHARPGRIVCVSCDIATFARDTRTLVDAGYALQSVVGMDLFPNTAHVETVAEFVHR